MLRHDILAQQLERYTATLIERYGQEYTKAQLLWCKLLADEECAQKVMRSHTELPIPYWQGALHETYITKPYAEPHRVFAVDGSQIYPDRHQGLPLYVINIGIADFDYGEQSAVKFETVPHLFYAYEDELLYDNSEMINCQRSELELKQGLLLSQQTNDKPVLFLCDGSLIAWHLTDNSSIAKKEFFNQYMRLFEQFRETNALIAGYISLPKSRDLIALVRGASTLLEQQDNVFRSLVDTDLLVQTLPPFFRSPLFESNVSLSEHYPKDIRTHFFYLNIGTEIARIEVPAWIAVDQDRMRLLEHIIVAQVEKGQGYPICLAEAHEQAVIKNRDREAFYQTIRLMFQEKGIPYMVSQKSIKKRSLGI